MLTVTLAATSTCFSCDASRPCKTKDNHIQIEGLCLATSMSEPFFPPTSTLILHPSVPEQSLLHRRQGTESTEPCCFHRCRLGAGSEIPRSRSHSSQRGNSCVVPSMPSIPAHSTCQCPRCLQCSRGTRQQEVGNSRSEEHRETETSQIMVCLFLSHECHRFAAAPNLEDARSALCG